MLIAWPWREGRPMLKIKSSMDVVSCGIGLVGLLAAMPGRAMGSPGAFVGPDRALPDRPSASVAVADPGVMEGVEAVLAPASWFTPVAVGALIITVVLTLVATWRAGRTHRPGRPKQPFRWTLGSKMALSFGLLGVLGVGSLVAWRLTDELRNDVKKQAMPLQHQAAILQAFDREGLRARIHARGFLVFEMDKHVQLFLDSVGPAGAYITRAKEIAGEDADSLARLEELERALGDYVNVIVNAVRLTDTKRAILEQQIDPTHAWLSEALSGDAGAQTLASDALRLTYASAMDDDAEGIRSVKDLVSSAAGGAPESARGAVADAVAFYHARLDEIAAVAEERQYWIRQQCPPTGMRLGELSTLLASDLREEARAMETADVAAASLRSKWTSVGVLGFLMVGAVFVWSMVRNITKRTLLVADALGQASEGDLTAMEAVNRGNDELSMITGAASRLRDAFASLIRDARGTSEAILTLSRELDDSAKHLAESVEQQSKNTNQVSAAVTEMAASIEEVREKSCEGERAASESGQRASDGVHVVSDTVRQIQEISSQFQSSSESIAELGSKSDEIGEIITAIDDIADQTNLLALNAAIEAARAGEHGRGFAVVADEVRKLAERTTQATEQVSRSISETQENTGAVVESMQVGRDRVETGVRLATEASESLASIQESSADVRQMVSSITAASAEQATASREIATAIETIVDATRGVSTNTDRVSDSSGLLLEQAERLTESIKRYRID